MSCVTNTIVLRTSPCSRRNSSCSRCARDRVDGGERLVHQQHRRVGGERARDADALLLTAGELRRVALRVRVGVEPDELEQLARARLAACAVPAEQRRHGRDVGLDRQVREQADLLDDVADAAAQLRPGRRW